MAVANITASQYKTIWASNGSFSTARNDTTGNVRYTAVQATFTGSVYFMERGYFTFDTSTLPAGAIISAATIKLVGEFNADGIGSVRSFRFYDSSAADTPVAGDYDAFGSTPLSDAFSTSGWNAAGDNFFTINAAGLAAINPSGNTKFCLRDVAYDVGNSAPPNFGAIVIGSVAPVLNITYTVVTDVTVNATVLAGTLSIPAVTVTAIRNESVSPAVQSVVASIPAPTVTAIQNATISPSALSATFSIPAVNIITPDAQIDASVVTATFSIPTATASGDANVSQDNVLSATFSTPSPSLQIDFSHPASAFSATFSIPAVTIFAEASVTVTPDALEATFSLPEVTVTTEQNAMVEAGVLTATFSVQEVTVTAVRHVEVAASVLSATFSIQTPRKVGGLWSPQPRVEGVWTPQARVTG